MPTFGHRRMGETYSHECPDMPTFPSHNRPHASCPPTHRSPTAAAIRPPGTTAACQLLPTRKPPLPLLGDPAQCHPRATVALKEDTAQHIASWSRPCPSSVKEEPPVTGWMMPRPKLAEGGHLSPSVCHATNAWTLLLVATRCHPPAALSHHRSSSSLPRVETPPPPPSPCRLNWPSVQIWITN
jgi:hypothetical protein